MMREQLPSRRQCTRFDMPFNGIVYTVTLGEYPDGRLGEVFMAGGKSGTDVEAVARDCAVLASLALQHGTPVETIRRALTRVDDSTPAGPAGKLFDLIVSEGV